MIAKYTIPLLLIFFVIGCAEGPKDYYQQDQSSSQSTTQDQSTQSTTQTTQNQQDQTAPPTYNKDVKPIIDQNCIGCHSPNGMASQYPLDSYQKIVNGQTSCANVNEKRYVVPSNSQVSYLYKKLIGSQDICGRRMPPGGSLPQDKIDTIRKWIDAGAPE